MKLMLRIKKTRTVLSLQKSMRIELPSFYEDEDFSETLTRVKLYGLDGLLDPRGSTAQASFNVVKE